MEGPVVLEELYGIGNQSYTTGSETLDGLLVGLATLLLIRNGEFVVLDALTFIFGNRRHQVGFRVLRMWQMLNGRYIYRLITGFDSDMPTPGFCSYLRCIRSSASVRPVSTVKKGRFAPWLFISVLLGKVLVLGVEVVIIALVIPVAKVHTSENGMSFRWKNATITEASLSQLHKCQPMLTSYILTDTAQIVLCKRINLITGDPRPRKWAANASLRVEITEASESTREQERFQTSLVSTPCSIPIDQGAAAVSRSSRTSWNQTSRQRVASTSTANASLKNVFSRGELEISGNCLLDEDGETFEESGAAVLPFFSTANVGRGLRLAFTDILLSKNPYLGLTINGKQLLFDNRGFVGQESHDICPEALKEIMRNAGSLDPELLIDIFMSVLTVDAGDHFVEASQSTGETVTSRGFEIGTSRMYRIPPEWMIAAAVLIVVLSSITSRCNRTEERVARVYRERNNMWGACSPAYLDEEEVVEGGMFRMENQYHWGESPDDGWVKQPIVEFSEGAVLV